MLFPRSSSKPFGADVLRGSRATLRRRLCVIGLLFVYGSPVVAQSPGDAASPAEAVARLSFFDGSLPVAGPRALPPATEIPDRAFFGPAPVVVPSMPDVMLAEFLADEKGGSKTDGGKKADAKPTLEKRLETLEKALQKRDEADKKAADAAAKKFVVRPFGRLHMDGVAFNQDAANMATPGIGNLQNGVDIRRARLGVEGEGFDIFFYRFDVDFVTFDQQSQKRPVIVDAYFDTQQLPVIGNLRVGHFREPMSLDRVDSTHDLPFMERATVTSALVPFRNMGVMAFDCNREETRTWSYGMFSAFSNQEGEDVRDRAGYALTGRTTWLPYYDELSGGRYLVHLGAGYSYRRLGDQAWRFNSRPELQVKQDVVSFGGPRITPNFVDTGLINLYDYHVVNFEAMTNWGSLGLQAEYTFAACSQVGNPLLYFQGGYVEAMYWLTGENRNYDRKVGYHRGVTPNSNFFRVRTDKGIETGRGAWEIAARYSNIDLISQNVNGGNLNEITLGLNWYYAVRCRLMFNYVHMFLDRDNIQSNADGLGTRFQMAF